jgi:hypothetical protein
MHFCEHENEPSDSKGVKYPGFLFESLVLFFYSMSTAVIMNHKKIRQLDWNRVTSEFVTCIAT